MRGQQPRRIGGRERQRGSVLSLNRGHQDLQIGYAGRLAPFEQGIQRVVDFANVAIDIKLGIHNHRGKILEGGYISIPPASTAVGGLLAFWRLRRLVGHFLRFLLVLLLHLASLLLKEPIQGLRFVGFGGLVGVLHQGQHLVLGERLLQLAGALILGDLAAIESVPVLLE